MSEEDYEATEDDEDFSNLPEEFSTEKEDIYDDAISPNAPVIGHELTWK